MHLRSRIIMTGFAFLVAAAGGVKAAEPGAPTEGEILNKLLGPNRGIPVLGTPTAAKNPSVAPASALATYHPAQRRSEGVSASRSAAHPVPVAAVPTAAKLAETGRIPLNTIEFQFGSDRLKPASMATLKALGAALNRPELKDTKILIEGHTDAIGSRAYNDALSERRAEAVKAYLVHEMGVSADRLQAVGKGFSEPALPDNPRAAANRRVVVVNLGNG